MILNRQNIYDGTLEKTASMSWGFVPLTAYHGGGADAVLEPLHQHLDAYRQLMVQYYGAGVQACYRGPRLFDTDSTREMVTGIVKWYKAHREILNSDMIQLRRADGRDWDGFIHVNPALEEKGFVLLFNPTGESITRSMRVPLYYTGLRQKALVRDMKGNVRSYSLDRDYSITMNVKIPAGGWVWFVIQGS